MKKVIEVHSISKKYIIGHKKGSQSATLRDVVMDQVRSFLPWNSNEKEESNEIFWALRDISFSVKEGDRLAIIGANGAGKSTLLKILSRIIQPTKGNVKIAGRVASLLEVGTGFHPELTGRENIFLNGSILGMKREEIRKNFEAIVDFSGIEKFIDTPVKRYSSGMYVRLGFAIAAHLDPEIMIVDEVLAVGDAEFQKKCLGKMKESSESGRTILFVSHNLTAVQSLCNKAVFLEKGKLVESGETNKVISTYLSKTIKNKLHHQWEFDNAPGNEFVKITEMRIVPEFIGESKEIDVRTPFTIECSFLNLMDGENELNLSLFLYSITGEVIFNVASTILKSEATLLLGRCEIPGDLLNDGSYSVTIFVVKDTSTILYSLEEALSFDVIDFRYVSGKWYGKWLGAIRPKLQFQLSQKI